MNWLTARLRGLLCLMLAHDVEWASNKDEVCAGDIVCHTCNLIIWCRWYDPKWLGGRKE